MNPQSQHDTAETSFYPSDIFSEFESESLAQGTYPVVNPPMHGYSQQSKQSYLLPYSTFSAEQGYHPPRASEVDAEHQ